MIEILLIITIMAVIYPVLTNERFAVTAVLLAVLYLQSTYNSYIIGYRAAEADRIF